MKLWQQVRAFVRREAPSPSRGALVARRPHGEKAPGRTVVVAEGSLPMAEMYADVLRGQGLPALLRSAGVGRGALGGAGVEALVLVPEEVLAQARDILGIEGSD